MEQPTKPTALITTLFPRSRVVEGPPNEAGERAWARIRSNLSGGELTVLSLMFAEGSTCTLGDFEAFIAPMILEWNVAEDAVIEREVPAVLDDDGTEVTPARTVPAIERRPLPPPAEAGPDVLRKVALDLKLWLKDALLSAPFALSDAAAKRSRRSDDAPGGRPTAPPPTAPEAPSTRTGNRRSRTTSGASSPTPAASTSPR